MILHGGKASPFFRKVIVALEEKGLPYEIHDLAPIPKTPELMALNPLGKIPILSDGDLTLPDSSVICAYLERAHPSPRLYPEEAADFGRALFLEEYADTKMGQSISPAFFERFIKVQFFQAEPDEAVVKNALEVETPPVLDYLEGLLGEGGAALLGTFSIADIAVGTQLTCLTLADESIDAARWPKMASYYDGLLGRPSFKECLPA